MMENGKAAVNDQTDEILSIATTLHRAKNNDVNDDREEGKDSYRIEKRDIGGGNEVKTDTLGVLLSAAIMNSDGNFKFPKAPGQNDMPSAETSTCVRSLEALVVQEKINQEAGGSSAPFQGQEDGASPTEMSEFEAVWRNRACSHNQSLGILEANRTRLQVQRFLEDPNTVTENEKTEMAV